MDNYNAVSTIGHASSRLVTKFSALELRALRVPCTYPFSFVYSYRPIQGCVLLLLFYEDCAHSPVGANKRGPFMRRSGATSL